MNENYTYQNGEPDYYELYTQKNLKEAGKTFSRIHLAIFVYVLVAYAVIFIAEVVLIMTLGEERFLELLKDNNLLNYALNFIPQYLIALPIFFLMVKGMKTKRREKTKMSASEFFSLFLISQAAMFVGSLIGDTFNEFFARLKGEEIFDFVTAMVEDTPIWLLILVVVIIGPIVEELIFRKLIIDRLSRYGELIAIMSSAIAFGLFHGNFYQFFYTIMFGLILGYIYAKTRNIKYSIFMHMLANFINAVAVLPVLESYDKFIPQLESVQNGIEVDMADFVKNAMIVGSYSVIQYAVIISGIILLIKGIQKKRLRLNSTYEYRIPKERAAAVAILNPGPILFLVLSIAIFVYNIVVV